MGRYLNHVGWSDRRRLHHNPARLPYSTDPERRPRFIALAAEIDAFDAAPVELPERYPYRHAPDDVVALIHSSGTTGTPKSTMLAHRQFWDGKQPRMVRFPAEPYDRLMCLMPHTHAGGLSYFLTATLLGLPMVAMGDWRRVVVEPVRRFPAHADRVLPAHVPSWRRLTFRPSAGVGSTLGPTGARRLRHSAGSRRSASGPG